MSASLERSAWAVHDAASRSHSPSELTHPQSVTHTLTHSLTHSNKRSPSWVTISHHSPLPAAHSLSSLSSSLSFVVVVVVVVRSFVRSFARAFGCWATNDPRPPHPPTHDQHCGVDIACATPLHSRLLHERGQRLQLLRLRLRLTEINSIGGRDGPAVRQMCQ